MKIPVSRLRDDQLEVFEDKILPKDLDIDIGIMHFSEPIRVQAEVFKSEEDLTVNAHLEGERVFTCSLCLEPFNNLFEKDCTLHYDIKGLETVTLDSDLRDELLLDHPIRVLCRPDCKGLCHQCGTNLNDKKCDCKKES